jgi:hypothetical protein
MLLIEWWSFEIFQLNFSLFLFWNYIDQFQNQAQILCVMWQSLHSKSLPGKSMNSVLNLRFGLEDHESRNQQVQTQLGGPSSLGTCKVDGS